MLPGQIRALLPPSRCHGVVVLPSLPGLHGLLLRFRTLYINLGRTTLHGLQSWLTGRQL